MYDKLFMAQITDKNGLLILKSFRREYSAGIRVCVTLFRRNKISGGNRDGISTGH